MDFISFMLKMIVNGFTGVDGVIGFVFAAMMAIIICLIIGCILWGAYWAVDYIGTEKVEGEAVIIGREFVEAHTTTTIINNVPSTTYHSDAWYVNMERGSVTDQTQVSESFFDAVKNGDKYKIMYKTGRISGGMLIKEILNKID